MVLLVLPKKKIWSFPSAAAGWVISNESFLAKNKVLSFLKLRASFGLTGNAGIGNFDYKGLYGIGTYNGTSSLYPASIANPDLTWEKLHNLISVSTLDSSEIELTGK